MDIAVVFESMFGNTRAIAEAIADGLRSDPDARVTVARVAAAGDLDLGHVDLLVVGGPTHYLRTSSPRTRKMAQKMGDKPGKKGSVRPDLDPGASGPGVREWLDFLPRAILGSRAAAFDTRFGYPMAGGAARPIAHRLRRHGYSMAAKPEGFVVTDMAGPLLHDEQDRARAWGVALLSQIPDRKA